MSADRFGSGDGPLMRWGAELRRLKGQRHRTRIRLAGLAAISACVLASAPMRPVPRLLWNATPSAPVGLYRVRVGALPGRGDRVVVWLPEPAAWLAARRGYLPRGVPAVKQVAGVPGDRICADRTWVFINGDPVAHRLMVDGKGRSLPLWRGCRTLGPSQFLLLNRALRSFDGRYFGPTERVQIIGVATALWLR